MTFRPKLIVQYLHKTYWFTKNWNLSLRSSQFLCFSLQHEIISSDKLSLLSNRPKATSLKHENLIVISNTSLRLGGQNALGKQLTSLNSNSGCSTSSFTYTFSTHLAPRSPLQEQTQNRRNFENQFIAQST